MMTRSAACLITLTLVGMVVATSVRTSSVSPETTAGIDIATLSAATDAPRLPLLVVNDPI